MKTYNDLEKEVIKDYGFENVEDLLSGNCGINLIRDFIYDLTLLAQKQALQNASENAFNHFIAVSDSVQTNVKKAITNENNILK